jgi:hypothetical protein
VKNQRTHPPSFISYIHIYPRRSVLSSPLPSAIISARQPRSSVSVFLSVCVHAFLLCACMTSSDRRRRRCLINLSWLLATLQAMGDAVEHLKSGFQKFKTEVYE